MNQTASSEITLQSAAAPRKRSYKQTFRAAGAAALSVAMVGIFALPAQAASHAIPDEATAHALLLSTVSVSSPISTVGGVQTLTTAPANQLLSTDDAGDIAVPAELPTAEEQPVVVVEEEVVEEVAAARTAFDIPAGAGADGIVNAAYAQLGISQDCTDLVQNSLSALGIVSSRLNGGPDLGTSVGTWAQFGYVVTDGSYAPGDILIWPGYHVAIYVGNGSAVHGGWTNGGRHGESTVVTGAFATGAPSAVVRVG